MFSEIAGSVSIKILRKFPNFSPECGKSLGIVVGRGRQSRIRDESLSSNLTALLEPQG